MAFITAVREFSSWLNNAGVPCGGANRLGNSREKSEGGEAHAELVRCPYCVQGEEFRQMVDLTGGAGGTFYCTICRHLVRRDEPEFQCLCAHCREVNSDRA